ncbi:metallophosphoesterase [Sphingomonas sp. BN140010]|uniref:Metallophosphoesterase n=1 Tax=Sphingomonas arvum TaxID=2992113 RepID=A0ABT3JI33_9SPHN|nr:metallophosphoesterase [Sphingomonas sp. BN140010]MCW3798431.1 metallophosphoesterase [Sphingomonas sp. BN140010]
MFGRLLRCLLPLLALLTSPTAWAQAPGRIVAVGDLHGDFDAWQAIARAAGLIDDRGRWSGGRTVLVQTGDIVDRGAGSRRILDHLMRLQREAPRVGGRVVVLTGNHEAMNVTGDLRYVDPGEYAAFATRGSVRLRDLLFEQQRAAFATRIGAAARKLSGGAVRQEWDRQTPLGLVEHQLAFSPVNGVYGRWIAANPVVAKMGDTLFVHGGLSAEYARFPLDELNRRAAAELKARSTDEAALINDPLGPLWYRGLVTRAPDPDEPPLPPGAVKLPSRPGIATELTQVLAATGTKRMVIGHTPSLKGIVIDHDARLIRIDTGISRYYGGPLSYLEIIGERLVPHVVPRPSAGTGMRQ